ncbi:hypothetical protein QFW80_09120 [Luteimonas sp. M1R5S18]|uniref:Uncharacterized protein n=1 Tax=Luteimonas rhizosphaericola TaxID=3042024 RepID=A0ABT6JJ18_9GAMM|nr:hypothetical protein [Luteimonas rhizosphaericola]MDH5830672.1 hypothetical protein [Luteimonas rhizosphaericola]
MPITRAKASRLLNQSEMGLYDDSRANGLRDLDARALTSRVKRARTARDRARDLVQKQKLASRARTGSKRGASGADNQRSKDKAELTADILKRFEQQLRTVERADREEAKAAKKSAKAQAPKRGSAGAVAKSSAARKAGSSRSAAKKTAAKKSVAKKPVAKKATARKAAAATPAAGTRATKQTTRSSTTPATGNRAGKATGGSGAQKATGRTSSTAAGTVRKAAAASPSNAKKTRTRDASRPTAPGKKAPRKRRITPEQALEQTRALLEAKQAHDAEPRPWQDLPTGPAVAGEPGFQSDAAARRAARLHAAEARIPAIQGSVSTRDRINQGKRDHRGGSD